jgi:SpoIID/LytB domain protein
MRRILIVAALVTGLVAASAPAARADRTFTMFGAGWGHGLGFSQYGGLGLAQKGWARDGILQRFYAGTSVAAMSSPPAVVRVGLIQGYVSTRVKAVGGSVNVKVGGTALPNVATIPEGETWTIAICSGKYCVKRPDGTTAFTGGGTGSHLYLTYQAMGNSVYLYGTAHTYDRGWMELNLYVPCTGCALDLRVINVAGPQGYLYGLGEVPNSWPTPVLEAQAIAARTYAFYKIRTGGQNRPVCNCAVYASTLDQVYIGADKVNSEMGERWKAAVDATNNLVVLNDGAPIGAFYHSSSGGYTEHNENIWGGTPLDYLRGRCDPGDYTTSNPNRTWSLTLTGATIGNLLATYTGVDIGDATSFSNLQRGVSGRLITATVNGTLRSVTVSGSTLRRALGLKDVRVWINGNKNVTGNIRTTYDARMCAPGLQTSVSIPVTGGRYQTFVNGRIYAHYALNAAFWTHGPIKDKYVAMGAHNSLLGLPRTGIQAVGTTGGTRETFDGGRIYWKSSTGAHEVHGRILTVYLSKSGAGGALGFPVTDVVTLSTGELRSTFEHGTITCPNSSTGTCTTVFT